MNKKELAEAENILANSKHLDWYHRFEIELGSGVFTPGRLDTNGYTWRREFVGLTKEFVSGKRVLDIGAYSGAFSFLMQDLGADVVAVDVYDPEYNGFNLVKTLRKRDLKHYQMSVYDLDPEEIGKFDIVAFYGVHYHLKHPILAFERCNSVCKRRGLLVGGGTGLDAWYHDEDTSCLNGANFEALNNDIVRNEDILSLENINELSLCGFSTGQFLRDETNWFIPNLKCLLSWVEASGFKVAKSHKFTAPIVRDWNSDERVKRTSLNFISEKCSSPGNEYTSEMMKQYYIPTQGEVNRLKEENESLKLKLREFME